MTRRECLDRIDRIATRLYLRLNPNYMRVIRVSKHDCNARVIRLAKKMKPK